MIESKFQTNMIALLIGLALVILGCWGFWRLHAGEKAREQLSPMSLSRVARYLAVGLGEVSGLILIMLGGAVVVFACSALGWI